MCGSNWASYIPPRAISPFFFISYEIPPYGHFTPLRDFTFEYFGRVKFLVYRKREVKCPGAPRGVCATPNLNQTLLTFISHSVCAPDGSGDFPDGAIGLGFFKNQGGVAVSGSGRFFQGWVALFRPD